MIFKFVILSVIVAMALGQNWANSINPVVEAPKPYEFGFKAENVNHTLARQESGDGAGNVRGSYSYIDRNGAIRTVNYVADINGFRATVVSNEPGLVNAAPAGATINIQ